MSFVAGLNGAPLFVDGCLTKEAIGTFMDGLLPNKEMDIVVNHLNECAACNQLFTLISSNAMGLLEDFANDIPHDANLPLALPSRFGVIRTLGATGRVFEVTDKARHQNVALKILRFENQSHKTQFESAFYRFKAVSSPNLVRLHEFFSGAHCFFTMELLSGMDIVTYSKQTKSGLSSLFYHLCSGLSSLHHAGIVHRNIKPSNILITDQKRVVLLDFGLAVETESGQGSPSNRYSTLAYMAPEQTLGQPASTASDWYGIGALLYECLTGHVPFDSATGPLIHDKRELDPPPPEVPDTSLQSLKQLSQRLLSKKIATRPRGPEILKLLAPERTIRD